MFGKRTNEALMLMLVSHGGLHELMHCAVEHVCLDVIGINDTAQMTMIQQLAFLILYCCVLNACAQC